MSELRRRLLTLFRRKRFERELEEEMQLHIELLAEEDPEGARRRFGNPTLLKEDSRSVWGWSVVESILNDLRFAARVLRHNPGFTLVAALTLALGVGANSAVFSLVDAFLFRPVAMADAARLVALADRTERHAGWPISYPNFLDWQERNQVFESMAAYRVTAYILTGGGGAERIPVFDVSDDFLRTLGVKPALGRDFIRGEQQPVALLSHELWQRRYGGDPAVLGSAVSLSGRSFTVIGILPPGFRIGPRADALTSIEQWGREPRGAHNSLYGVARLKPGVTLEQARGQMDAIAAGLEQQYPDDNKGRRVDILPFGRVRIREIRSFLLMLLGVAGFVLLIACANLSNLLLAKASGRGREMGIRKALGASRARLLRQLAIEGLALGTMGGLLGLFFGYAGCRGLLALLGDLDRLPGGEPLGGIHVDARVFAFTMLAAVLTGIAAGLAPAFRGSPGDLGGRSGAGGLEGRRFRDFLVTAEVALALILVTGAGLLIRSLYHLVRVERGFDARNVVTLSLAQAAGHPSRDLCRTLLEEIQALPGVEAAAFAFPLPFGHGFSGADFHVEGRPVPRRWPSARVHYVSPGYFRTLELRLLRGRWFTAADDARTAVINETMARQHWPGEDPVGRHFRTGVKSPWYTVLGVAAGTRENGLETSPGPAFYLPGDAASDFLVRTAADPMAMVGALRGRVHSVDASLAVYEIFPLEGRISESLRDQRTLTWLFAIFAALALALASVGIYGVVAHSVSRRTQELGIRMALGGRPGDMMRLVVRQGMLPVLVGIGLGLGGAHGATRLLGSVLFGVEPTDPLTFAGVGLLLGMVALLACYLPARRAIRVNPVDALRYE